MNRKLKNVLQEDFWIMPATPNYVSDGIAYITSKNIKNGKIDFNNSNYISKESYELISKNRPILVGDFLISMIGTLGEIAEVTEQDGMFYGQNMFLVRLDQKQIDKRYFVNYFKSDFVKRFLSSKQNQSTQKYLKANHIEDLPINIPSLEEQVSIARKLDKLNLIITRKKEELILLDTMVKSRFIELFGERLEKETVKLSTLTEVITKGTTPTTLGFEFTESGVNFVKIECITEDGKFIVTKMLHISDECNQKLKRSILQEGDVLFSIAGAIGRTAIVTKEILPANTNQAVAIIRLRKDCGLNVKFLNQMLHSSLIEKQVNVKKAGVAQINLSLTDIGDFNIAVPTMEEQEQFAAFVEQIDKSKFKKQNINSTYK